MSILFRDKRTLDEVLFDALNRTLTVSEEQPDIFEDDEDDRDYLDLKRSQKTMNWELRGDRHYGVGVVHPVLPPAIYVAKRDGNGGLYFKKAPFITDSLINFPGTPIDYILGQIKTFWDNRSKFKACGFLHKRGVLLYGPAGCGKTSVIKMVADDVIARKGLVIYIQDFHTASEALKILRNIEPNRPIVAIEEDVETFMQGDKDDAREFLSFLDGESQLENIVHLATTNNPDELEDRIIKRPGRFDLIVQMKPPVDEARRAYLKLKLSKVLDDNGIEELVEDTRGLGFSHLRDVCVCSVCLGLDREETIKRLRSDVKEKVKVAKLGDSSELGFTVGFPKK